MEISIVYLNLGLCRNAADPFLDFIIVFLCIALDF